MVVAKRGSAGKAIAADSAIDEARKSCSRNADGFFGWHKPDYCPTTPSQHAGESRRVLPIDPGTFCDQAILWQSRTTCVSQTGAIWRHPGRMLCLRSERGMAPSYGARRDAELQSLWQVDEERFRDEDPHGTNAQGWQIVIDEEASRHRPAKANFR